MRKLLKWIRWKILLANQRKSGRVVKDKEPYCVQPNCIIRSFYDHYDPATPIRTLGDPYHKEYSVEMFFGKPGYSILSISVGEKYLTRGSLLNKDMKDQF